MASQILSIPARLFNQSDQKYADLAGMTLAEWRQETKFTGIDLGWIIMNVGMAVGAGIVFLPVQVGLSGFLIFLLAAGIGYPIMYQHQKLYLNVLAESPKCEDFAGIISGYLGKNWGFFLGILYFLLTTILIFLYSTALTNDSASFLVTFGVTDTLLSDNIFYGLAVITFLVLIASQGEKLLMKVSSGMVFTKVFVIAVLGIVMVQYWSIANISIPPDILYVIKQFIIILPFVAMSIEFFANLSPVVIYYRSHTDNKVVAHYRSMRTFNYAYFLLLVVVLFYTISFNLAINHDQAVMAYQANISSLALAAQNMDGAMVKILSLILNIFAVVTAYFAMFLGFRDSCIGIVMNILNRVVTKNKVNKRVIRYGISVFCVLICWGAIVFNAPILSFTSILSPLIGIIACLLPAYLVIRLDEFKKYRNWQLCPIILIGFFLVISPFIAFS